MLQDLAQSLVTVDGGGKSAFNYWRIILTAGLSYGLLLTLEITCSPQAPGPGADSDHHPAAATRLSGIPLSLPDSTSCPASRMG